MSATTTPTTVAEGEHRIAYAYPSSETACKVGRGKSGCYVVKTAGKMVPEDSYDAALANVKALGTQPGRWSVDHPLNAHFLAK